MTWEDVRIECLRLALECREAGQGPTEMIAIAEVLEGYVGGKAPPRIQKAPTGK